MLSRFLMQRYVLFKKKLFFIIIVLNIVFPAFSKNISLQDVELSAYGSLIHDSINNTIRKAVNDICGKRLFFPEGNLEICDFIVSEKSNFAISCHEGGVVNCKNFRVINCSDFEVFGVNIRGREGKFATFYVIGDCSNFSIHHCTFDSRKDKQGHNTFYGIHIVTDYNNPQANYSNSPRTFKIYQNSVRNTRYDGILTHAYCSDFIIEDNIIENAECIGIEVEGRLGDNRHTKVKPCKKAIIRNNNMINCGGWGILLMWADHVRVCKNKAISSFGPFLSIGCTNVKVIKNLFEGKRMGFEISQEFYKVANGINENIIVKGNTITGYPRSKGRGVLDIRHARNITVKKNRIYCVYREQSSCVSVSSSQKIKIKRNNFIPASLLFDSTIAINNVDDPETGKIVDSLNVHDVIIEKNDFHGMPTYKDADVLSVNNDIIIR